MSDTVVFYPLVSIIIRSMDSVTLQEALESIALQIYPNIEVVLVNAKGSDHTVISQWCGCFPVRMVGADKPLRRSLAANIGLDSARGDYLIFLDDDDWFEPNHIQKLVDAIRSRPEFKVVYTGVKCVDESNKPLQDTFSIPFDAIRLLAENFIPIHSVLFSCALLELGCRVDESFDMYEDWDFWIQLSKFSGFLFVDGLSAVYRINRQSESGVYLESSKRVDAMLAVYRKWHGELSDEQLIKIMQPIRQIPIKDKQILSLQLSVDERDLRIANLDQAVDERDLRIANLDQAVDERDLRIANLDQAVADYNEQISTLNQNEAKYEARIAALSQIVVEREAIVQEVFNSHSWRLSAPLRVLGTFARRVSEPGPRCGLFSRLIMAACVLPATFFHYRGLREWIGATRRGASFFAAVLINPTQSHARLAGKPRLVQIPVSLGISVAQRIHTNGGVLPSVVNMCLDRVFVHDTTVASAPVNLRRVLVADYRIPRPNVSSGERGTGGILMDLCSLGYEVVFLPNDLLPSPEYEAELHALGVTVITNLQGYSSPASYLSTQGHMFGAFHIFRLDVAEIMLDLMKQASPTARVIFHTVDLHFLREMREAELHQSDVALVKANRTRERELSIMRRVDQVVLVSSAEVPLLKEYLPDTLITVFPALYAPIARHPAPFEARRNIFFLGGFAHRPNVDAVQWFAREIWPLVRIRLSDVEFHIVGSEMPQTVQDLASVTGIRTIGFVPDLDPLIASMRLGVAPLRFGAGIKGKVAMIMGSGVPCVCSGIAAEGMHIHDGVHTLVADEPRAFADAVIRLYDNKELWEKFSANGQELISRNFGNEANRSSLLSLLDAGRALPISLFGEYCTALRSRAVPPENAVVDVSIIVPVYNKWALTKACLNSILETSSYNGISFEIVLADDVSTDETVRASEFYPGLKVVKTEKNVGFLRNCNNAASYACGRYFLFLNNDTIVLPGWLSSLYNTLEQDPGVAIVGSKLLYPDGTIQEAGGVLFSDGTALNIGRGQGRDMPVFNIEREADYISGASILVRKSFWEQAGGFDERYKNAYCEDVDLAMFARSLGMRVVYQPDSEVVHFEHQSYAGQSTAHLRGLQNHNTELVLEKWSDVFQRDHLPAAMQWQIVMANAERTAPASARERRQAGKLNVLYFSPFPSHPASHGNRAIINQLARHFQSMGHTVHFVLLQSNEYAEVDLKEMRATWDTLDVIPYTNPMWANGGPIPFDGWYEEGIGERIRCLCSQYDIDMVFCSYVFQSKLLEFVPSYILKVIDTHDKMGDRYDMLRKNGQPLEFFSCTPEEEGAYLRRADVVVALREEEASYFDSVTGKRTAVVLSHAEAPRFIDKDFINVRHVGLVASANSINLAMVRECLAAIERHLQSTDCPFKVHVVGQVREMVGRLSTKESEVFHKPWVHMHGFVQDIGEFYADMDLLLSPVTMGTGINVKTVQAMAYGMPLLTTECGVKGIETGDPMHMHTNLDALAASLFAMVEHANDLRRLAALSRDRYVRFYDENVDAITALFAHPKLIEADDE
ncbi:MAG: glycosyltransferase [Chloroflexota bacterium]